MHLSLINANTPSTIFSSSDPNTFVGTFVGRIFLFAIPLAGIYFLIRLIVSGYSFMSSLGDPAKIQAAQHQVVTSAFGLLLIIAAFFIAQIVQYIFHLNFL